MARAVVIYSNGLRLGKPIHTGRCVMGAVHIVWDLPEDPDGNVAHIASHNLTQEEVEDVLFDPDSDTTISRSSGEKITFGLASTGRYIAVAWEHVMDNPLTMRPITAYDVPEAE
jgi:hypothetical protein